MKLFEATYRQKWTYYERFYDTEAKESRTRIIDSKEEYYVEHPSGKYEYLLDPSIKLIQKSGKPNGKAYGILKPDQKLIRDEYWSKDDSKYNKNPNIWYMDIETTALSKIDIDNTPEEVVLIQIFDTSKKMMYVLGSKNWRAEEKYKKEYDFNVKYVNCKTESNIFEAMFRLLCSFKPLIVLGWNTNGYDYPYLYNRAKKIGLNTNKFSPFLNGTANLEKRTLDNGMLFHTLKADGIFYMDYLEIYKKYVYKPRPMYSLDYISKVELGEGKIDHECYSTFDGFRTGESYIMPLQAPKDEWGLKMYNLQVAFKKEPDNKKLKSEIREHANDLFVHYGLIDTYLVKKLDDKLRLSSILIMIASKMGVNISDAMGTVRPWASYINNIAFLEKKILPNDEIDKDADTSIKGGFVPEPNAGKHNWIISVDINSAYPNLSMRGFNMSAETFVPIKDLPDDIRAINTKYFNDQDEERRFKMFLEEPDVFKEYTSLAKKYNYCLGINGAVFTRNKQGLIPMLVKNIYADRSAKKKEMLDWKQKAENLHEQMQKRGLKIDNMSDEELIKAYEHAKYMEVQSNTEQMIGKVLINSLYGAQGNKYFRLFNIEIARAITANTRFYLQLLNYRINEFLSKKTGLKKHFNLYNDTDSGYYTLKDIVHQFYDGPDDVIKKTEFIDEWIKKELDPVIEACNYEFADILNAYEPGAIKAEREAISDCLHGKTPIRVKHNGKVQAFCISEFAHKFIDKKEKTGIANVKGYEILSLDSNNNRVLSKIKNVQKKQTTKKVIRLTNGKTSIMCTEDHRIAVKVGDIVKYKQAKDINEDDDVMTYNLYQGNNFCNTYKISKLDNPVSYKSLKAKGKSDDEIRNFFDERSKKGTQKQAEIVQTHLEYKGFRVEEIKQTVNTVYDLEVEETHNFLAGKIFVHNCGVFLAKKKYYLRVFDNEGVKYTADDPYMKTMGVEIVRSSTPPFVKKYLSECIQIILDKGPDELIDWLDEVKKEFLKQPLSDIAKTTGIGNLNYNLDNSVKPDGSKLAIPINSRAALASNRFIQNSEELSHRFTTISTGDKVKLLYLRMPNKIGQNIFAFIDPAFGEIFREDVDFDLCWDKYFMKALNIMIAPLGWNIEKRTESLDEW